MPTPGKATGRKAKEKDKGLELKERLEKAGNDEENWNIHKRRNQVRPEHKAPLTIRNRTLDYTKYARSVTMARARRNEYKREGILEGKGKQSSCHGTSPLRVDFVGLGTLLRLQGIWSNKPFYTQFEWSYNH
ncbi:hypothetical protein C0992_000231 [Termitomyces sp. T32_za158]|nr:hypothetical protein C0992_000231 [Termitomyces sp. T32_za158]